MDISLNPRQYTRVCEALAERINGLQDAANFADSHGIQQAAATCRSLRFEFCELLTHLNRAHQRAKLQRAEANLAALDDIYRPMVTRG